MSEPFRQVELKNLDQVKVVYNSAVAAMDAVHVWAAEMAKLGYSNGYIDGELNRSLAIAVEGKVVTMIGYNMIPEVKEDDRVV